MGIRYKDGRRYSIRYRYVSLPAEAPRLPFVNPTWQKPKRAPKPWKCV